MSDRERLAGYVDVWWEAIDSFTRLLEALPAEAWPTPTDLPGWDVHACAAHTAHLEAVLSGAPEETLEIEAGPHIATLAQAYTEQGVVARRDATPDELINEIRESATKRRTFLLTDPPDDGTGMPPKTPGDIPWTWETLLRNRPLDVWMHEQDVRRAVGRPGGLDTAPAQHTADYLARGHGHGARQRAAAPPGSTLVVAIEGSEPAAFGISDSGRGGPLPDLPRRPDRGARDGPRDVRAARRRPAATGRRPPARRRRRRPGRADPRRDGDHPVSWSPADIPSQSGRTALVTGVSVGGLGHYTALELARAGARVVLAGRNPDKLAETDASIREELPDAALERLVVDLADLSSVRSAATEAAAYGSLDLLVNNAGIMATPYRRTVDGFESQLATNHFGPFLLTGLLLPQLASGGRVVTVSSLMHRFAHKRSARRPAHQGEALPALGRLLPDQAGQPALHLRARPAAPGVRVVGVRPRGASRVRRHPPGRERPVRPVERAASPRSSTRPTGRSDSPPAVGAWPTLMAATADLPGSTYCGPSGLGEVAGSPRLVGWTRQAGDRESQRAAVGAVREGDRDHLPLTRSVDGG